MRVIGAAIIAFLAIGPIAAQQHNGSAVGFGNVVFPGLGHAPTGGNPFGNVVHPGIPSSGSNSVRRSSVLGTSAFPIYVGGYGYGYGSGYGYGTGYGNGYDPSQGGQQQPNVTVVYPPAQPPVVINQYLGAAPPDQGQGSDTASNMRLYQAPSNVADASAPEASYYLIAFKDHTIYSAVAYYVEGDTLHYFTEGNVHNQVSISLVDRQLTEQLNHERNVDVRLSK
jgi:hypothetical protein